VLELHRAGRPLNDIAVVVRSGQPYVPALRTAFERFGIPANYYFPRTLRETAEFRKADAWMTADPLRWVRQLDPAREYDALEFELRQRLPGLTMDQALASAATQAELLEPLEPFLREFRSVWGEADPIEECWPHFREYAGEAVVREAADLAGAVRVIDAQEARQWRIPVVFAPGLIEGEFPRTPREEPLFPDSLRRSLNAYGLMLRTMDDRMAEERFLCEHTLARGSDLVVASYPRFDRQGEPLQRAFCLEDREARLAADSVWPRPARSRAPAPAAGFVPPAAAAARHTAWRPSSIESFLQCPFQFYGRYTLRLAPAPERPDQRFSALARGSVIHNVLARYQERKGAVPFETLLDPLLEEARAEYGIPPGYEFELRRLEMLRHLRDFAREFAPASGGEARFEQPVRFTLAPGVELRGRIDRFDLYPNGAVAAYDFKYSKAPGFGKKIREQAPLVQGGLYLIALEQQGYRPRSFHYVALRDACQLVGWSDPPAVRELIERARYLTLESVERIRAGEIRVAPRDVQNCAWCELWDACRVDQQPAAAPEEVQVAHA
jgi:RecB family exonuclease